MLLCGFRLLFLNYSLSYCCIVSYILCLVTAVAELLDNAVDEVIKHIYCFLKL
jgi:hypothetical protein